jgi:hypothetical protein
MAEPRDDAFRERELRAAEQDVDAVVARDERRDEDRRRQEAARQEEIVEVAAALREDDAERDHSQKVEEDEGPVDRRELRHAAGTVASESGFRNACRDFPGPAAQQRNRR